MVRKTLVGFTLVELVLAIMVLGILAMIFVPKIANLSKQGNIVETQGSMATIRSAVAMKYVKNVTAGNIAFPTLSELSGGTLFPEGAAPMNKITYSRKFLAGAPTDCSGVQNGSLGWVYNAATGEVWAATDDCDDVDTFDF